VADDIVAEPEGGAHADPAETARRVKAALVKHLDELRQMDEDELREARWHKYESMGAWLGEDADAGA
jgi:acetyl-CoA carboxylase carboxyl transferase subunit alpha